MEDDMSMQTMAALAVTREALGHVRSGSLNAAEEKYKRAADSLAVGDESAYTKIVSLLLQAAKACLEGNTAVAMARGMAAEDALGHTP